MIMNTMISSSFIIPLPFIFFDYVRSQNPMENAEIIPNSPDSVSNFQPSLAVVIGMLAIMFSLTFLLLLYAKFCHHAAASSGAAVSHHIHDSLLRSPPAGVDKTVVESLPFFRFSSLRGSKHGLECAVCLARFEDVEILRLLPKCKHAFHIDCIDQWLEKHATCPLCRRKVSSDDLSHLSSSLRFLWNQTAGEEEYSGVEIYVEREECSNRGSNSSSRFSIGGSFRKTEEELMPIHGSMDCAVHPQDPHHRFNHKIVVSDAVLKNRWSNVSSSDLMFLNSEMLNLVSSARFSSPSLETSNGDEQRALETSTMTSIKLDMERKRAFESKLREIKSSSDDDHRGSCLQGPTSSKNTGFGPNALCPNEKRSMSEIVVHPRNKILDSSFGEINVREERRRRVWLPIARKTVEWFANRERRAPHSQI